MHLAWRCCRRDPRPLPLYRGFKVDADSPRFLRSEYSASRWQRLCSSSSLKAVGRSTVLKGGTMVTEEDAETDMKSSKFPFPQVFLEWLKQNGLDPAIYDAAHDLPRYIRLKPRAKEEISVIEEDLGVKLSKLSWLPGFYSVPSEVQIAGSKSYQEGKIYGMDAASGAAVAALDISPGDHVLDLCAAPGAKLCMLADLLKGSGTLTATDISQPRLAASRTMLIKYGLGNLCRLFLTDGTTFSLLPLRHRGDESAKVEQKKPDVGDTDDGMTKCNENRTGRPPPRALTGAAIFTRGCQTVKGTSYVDSKVYGEWKATKTAREKKAAKRLKYMEDALERVGGRESELMFYGKESGIVGMKVVDVFGSNWAGEDEASVNGYDKVLVDAECTHDGSLKHISKYEQWGWDTFERRFFNADRMSSITSLQLQLLRNGFRLLRVGGTLIYSTCSFTIAQNEDVVRKFLSLESNADVRDIEDAKNWPCKSGGLEHTLRFDPINSSTSGLFIAKIQKM